MNRKRRNLLLLAAKVLVAVGLLAWVLSQAHWRDYVQVRESDRTYAVVQPPSPAHPERVVVRTGALWWGRTREIAVSRLEPVAGEPGRVVRWGFATSIRHIRPGLLACSMGGFLLMFLIGAFRWWFLLRIARIDVSLWEVTRLTFVGLFFNAVVPGTVGGDVVKAYYVVRHTQAKALVLLSIFMDRLLGLTELVLLAALMILVVWAGGLEPYERLQAPLVSVAVVMAIVVIALALLFAPRLRRALRLHKLYQRLPIAHHIAALGPAAAVYGRNVTGMIQTVLITVAAHVALVGSVALAGASLGLEIAWHAYFVYVPLIYIIGAVPITPGGIGLIEQLFLLYFAAANPNRVLALALLARLIPILWSLPGAVVAVTGPRLPRTEAMEAELGLRDGGA